MKLRKLIATCAALALGLGAVQGAQALNISATGEITDWGFTPFSATAPGDWGNGAPPMADGSAGTDSGLFGSITYTEGNNSSPINLPGTDPAFTPAQGEIFDVEFLGWRITGDGTVGGSAIEILGISSIDPDNGVTFNGNTFHIGDIFLNVDGDASTGYAGYDLGMGIGDWTTNLNDPLHPGDAPYTSQGIGAYEIGDVDDIHGITDDGGYGFDATVSDATNPFAVRDGATVASLGGTYNAQSYDYGTVFGADEDGTWIHEYVISSGLELFDLDNNGLLDDLGLMTLHWTIECGNDLLQTNPVVPEPASLLLVGMGLGAAAISRRRRQTA